MSSTATTTNITAIDSKKPTTKQELIAANIKLLIEQLEAGQSDALTNYLTAMSRFHNYSFGNVLEIARQMPTATRVAGFWTWKNLGRSVKAGAERHPHPCPDCRRSPQEGRGSQEGHHQAERARFARIPQCLCLRCFADRRRRPADHARSLRRPRREHRPSGRIPRKHRASSLSTTRTSRPRLA